MLENFSKTRRASRARSCPSWSIIGQRVPVSSPTENPANQYWRMAISGWPHLPPLPGQTLWRCPTWVPTQFHCVTRWSKLDVKWTGIKVTDLCAWSRWDQKLFMLWSTAMEATPPIFRLTLCEENFAHTVFGEPLPAEHGGPMRLIVPTSTLGRALSGLMVWSF